MPKKKKDNNNVEEVHTTNKLGNKSLNYTVWRLSQTGFSREDAFWELCLEESKKKPHIRKISDWFREFDANSLEFVGKEDVKGWFVA